MLNLANLHPQELRLSETPVQTKQLSTIVVSIIS